MGNMFDRSEGCCWKLGNATLRPVPAVEGGKRRGLISCKTGSRKRLRRQLLLVLLRISTMKFTMAGERPGLRLRGESLVKAGLNVTGQWGSLWCFKCTPRCGLLNISADVSGAGQKWRRIGTGTRSDCSLSKSCPRNGARDRSLPSRERPASESGRSVLRCPSCTASCSGLSWLLRLLLWLLRQECRSGDGGRDGSRRRIDHSFEQSGHLLGILLHDLGGGSSSMRVGGCRWELRIEIARR